jgi:hypothetical protein
MWIKRSALCKVCKNTGISHCCRGRLCLSNSKRCLPAAAGLDMTRGWATDSLPLTTIGRAFCHFERSFALRNAVEESLTVVFGEAGFPLTMRDVSIRSASLRARLSLDLTGWATEVGGQTPEAREGTGRDGRGNIGVPPVLGFQARCLSYGKLPP